MSDSSSFLLLDQRIQRFLWSEGWEELRDAQEAAIPIILNSDRDVIIAAATATGKTEAAFLPALTLLLQGNLLGLIVYIGPLKALINDQFERVDRLCENLEIPVWPWHGDISPSQKARFLNKPHGILLIMPESLEAILCRRGSSVAAIFSNLKMFIVDELHAFIGSERGKQLQSLMHRIESTIHRKVPRVGLSATLGDMRLAAGFIRPAHGDSVVLVESSTSTGTIKIWLKGYEEPAVIKLEENKEVDSIHAKEQDEQPEPITPARIAIHMYSALRGTNNLVFPNSRAEVERYTFLLNKLCEEEHVPKEFWPHHGSLSKEIRSDTEIALKQREKPATAICTNTLELGIDIGAVKSVAQIGPPPSVASLRQRLGRSGRRKNESAILRGYCIEDALVASSSLASELRLNTIQLVAMIELLLGRWFEPPVTGGEHLSTLVQQILSFIAQNGGASITQLYNLLCRQGAPFSGVSKGDFIELIRTLGQKELLIQDPDGTLLHGRLGEKHVNHYTFYAAFTTVEEFRIVCAGRVLGTLPITQILSIGQRILFAGKTWLIEAIEEEQKTIVVVRTRGGTPPMFSGGGGRIHSVVRQRMRQLLEREDSPTYLDDTALRFVWEARSIYKKRNLANEILVDQGREVMILTWLGDATNEALACLLNSLGFSATAGGPGVEVRNGQQTISHIHAGIRHIANCQIPTVEELLSNAKNLQREKWDWSLSEYLLRRSYASLYLDLEEAVSWARGISADPL